MPFLNQPLVPAAVAPGGAGFTLRVSGTGFVSGATIDFNGTPLTTAFVDSGHLNALVPAADIATAKTASVAVVNPAPGGGPSNVVYFQVGTPETTVSFANAPNSPLQIPEPAGLAIADFNQDGKPDLAVAAGTRQKYVMLSNGDGTFASAPGSPVPIPSPPYDDFASPYVGPLAVGDFNHSGHAGLAVGEWVNASAVILLGNGNGTLAPSSAAFVYSPGDEMSAIEAADFNGDGNLDLTLINQLGYPSFVALGYGKGAFNSAGDPSTPRVFRQARQWAISMETESWMSPLPAAERPNIRVREWWYRLGMGTGHLLRQMVLRFPSDKAYLRLSQAISTAMGSWILLWRTKLVTLSTSCWGRATERSSHP